MTKETQNIEWKKGWRDEYLKWVCGFANAHGGKIYIGKDNHGQVTGLKNSKKLMEDIPNKVRDILGIMVDVNSHSTDDGDYLEIIVEPYPYPISYKGQYHYRSGSTKQELKGAALDRFLLRKQGKHWDSVPVPGVKAADLSESTFDSFRKAATRSKRLSKEILEESNEVLIRKLHLTENEYLKRAAVLLFHDDPEIWISGSYIKIGYFESNSNLLYQDEIHGNLFHQVKVTLDLLLTKYMKAKIHYEGLQRIETFPVPEPALREALMNAIAHKDYASSIPIQISVYDDKLMIWNPGILPQGWSVETLHQKHSSQPFNPDIANALFRAGMIESWGRGIEMIENECLSNNCPKPIIKLEDSGVWIEFPYNPKTLPKKTTQETADSRRQNTTQVSAPENQPENAPEKVQSDSTTQEIGKDTTQKTAGSSRQNTTQETEKMTTQEMILNLIKINPEVTRNELANEIGITTEGIKYHLTQLRKKRIIKHFGPTKAGYWKILKDD